MNRYFVTWMCFFVNMIFYCMRLNLNIAIIEMVRSHNRTTEMQVPKPNVSNGNETPVYCSLLVTTQCSSRYSTIPSFNWDILTQQMILGAFYVGYAFMPIPGGWLAGKIGGKRVIGFGMIWTSLLTALIPWTAGVSVGLLVALRVLDGIGQGTSPPAMYVLLSKWTVPNEQSKMISIAFIGRQVGAIVCCFLSGWICSAYELGGWPMSFYIYSIFGAVLAIMWAAMIAETPHEDIDSHPVPVAEKDKSKNSSVPWYDIFTSSAVLAVVISYAAYDFGYYFIFTEAPVFISTVLGADVQITGMLTSILSFAYAVIGLLAAVIADCIIQRKYLSVLNTRKLFVIIALGVPSVCLSALGYVGYNIVASVVLLTIAFGVYGSHGASILSNVMDITTNYSGIISGVMYTIASCTGFISPIILGLLTENENDLKQWSVLFKLTAGIHIFGLAIFLIFAKGEEQKWSKYGTTDSEEKRNLIE